MLSGSFSIWHWMIVLVLVIAVFGTKKLRNAGSDLGTAVRNFRSAMHEGEAQTRREQALIPVATEGEAAPALVPRDRRAD